MAPSRTCFVYNMSCFLFFPYLFKGVLHAEILRGNCHGWWVVDFWPFGLLEEIVAENPMTDPWDW